MINLYRGISDRFTSNIRQLEDDFKELIRGSYTENPDDNAYGSAGFWNFLLEIVLTLFVRSFIILSILLTVSMASIFFPLNAVKNAFANLFTKMGPTQFVEEPRKEPTTN